MPWLDAVENVMVPLLLQGLDETAARRRAEAALAALGLAEIGDKLPEELSGGEAQVPQTHPDMHFGGARSLIRDVEVG